MLRKSLKQSREKRTISGLPSLWFLDLCAVAAGLGLAAIFFLPRLPMSLDFILPRRSGFLFFKIATQINQSPVLRITSSWAALVVLCAALASATLYLYRRSQPPEVPWKSREGLLRAMIFAGGFYLAWRLARFAVSLCVDLIENVYFPPESLDLREPIILWACFSAVILASLRTAAVLWEWSAAKRSKLRELAERLAPAWLLLACSLGWYAWAVSRYDAGHISLDDAAGIPSQSRDPRSVIVLSEKEGSPHYEVHAISAGSPWAGFTPEGLETVEKYLSRLPTVFSRTALAYLYDGYAVRMDGDRLRHALLRGHQAGDGLARMLLLENLAVSVPNSAHRVLLESLADEKAYRIGPKGCARIAAVYRHFGIADQAQYWRQRASEGEGAVASGLLALSEEGGALKPGVVRGALRAGGRVTVGLYARPDPYAPYALGPTQLVESVEADHRGRFEFRGLSAGEYFLAFSLDSLLQDNTRLSGHKGNIRLSSRHPEEELAPIAIKP